MIGHLTNVAPINAGLTVRPASNVQNEPATPLPSDTLTSAIPTEKIARPTFAQTPAEASETTAPSAPAENAPEPKGLPVISDGNRLVQPGTVMWELQPGWGHTKARTELGKDYPPRQIDSNLKNWNQVDKNYQPVHYEAPVLGKQPAWADPPSLQETLKKRELKSYLEQKFGADGQPLNPMGPTGMTGRGLLGKHGANFAADPIVTTINPQTGQLMMIAIVREDLGQVAIPGGMADHGEKVSGTLARELCEETLGKEEHAGTTMQEKELQDMFDQRATPVYQGYVDDPRNTDNAWMETQAFHLHLTPEEAAKLNLREGSDAKKVSWEPVTSAMLGKMYASHGAFVKQAVLNWQEQSGMVVGSDGTVGTAPR